MQNKASEQLDEEKDRWLLCKIEPKKIASIIAVQEKMVETKVWRANRGLPIEGDK